MPGTPDATPSSFFDVQGCAAGPPFAPGFVAGTVTPQAGQFSAFTLNFSREDREQFVKGIQIHTPPGLLGMLSSVPLCGEPAADAGTCPEASKIGTTRVASGAGSHPFEIEGNVYLTEPYDGAPFGLSDRHARGRGPVQPRAGRGAGADRREPGKQHVDDHDRRNGPVCDPADPRWCPAAPETGDGRHRPPRLHVQPDAAATGQQATGHGRDLRLWKREGERRRARSRSGAVRALRSNRNSRSRRAGRTSKADGASLDAKLSYPAGSVGSEANIA